MKDKELHDRLLTFVGKEVVYDKDNKKARISNLFSYAIIIEREEGGWFSYKTGTGERDNAVARGAIRFVDESLKEPFLEVYEAYINSDWGRIEDFEYYFNKYD